MESTKGHSTQHQHHNHRAQMENRFRALSLLRASAEPADSRHHNERRLASRAKPSAGAEQHLERGASKDASVEDEVVEEAGEEVWLDAFLLSLIFSHIHDGPFLASLRLVQQSLFISYYFIVNN
jgi:hypothetical protein